MKRNMQLANSRGTALSSHLGKASDPLHECDGPICTTSLGTRAAPNGYSLADRDEPARGPFVLVNGRRMLADVGTRSSSRTANAWWTRIWAAEKGPGPVRNQRETSGEPSDGSHLMF